jgi:hypothetical protein
LLALVVGLAIAGPPQFKPHLEIVGYDPIGEPGDGQNAELALDADEGFAYVGGLFGDNTVKAVDVSIPTNPTLTDVEAVNGSPFDVKIARHVLAAGLQIITANDGVVLMNISDRADPIFASTLSTTDIKGGGGSHNVNLWADDLTGEIWLFV